MSRRWMRLCLVTIMLAVLLGSGYRVFLLERQRSSAHQGADTYDALAWTLSVGLAELHSAQRAYVASGQPSHSWFEQVRDHVDGVDRDLGNLRVLSTAEGAMVALDEVSDAIGRLKAVDDAARTHVNAGEVLMASDLVFTDGLQLVRQARQDLELARAAESENRAQAIARHRTAMFATAAGGGVAAMMMACLLLPLPRKKSTGPRSESTPTGSADSGDAGVSANQLHRSRQRPDTAADDTDHPRPDLQLTARVCQDLGLASESTELAKALKQARDLLNASGLVIWVRDSSGQALRPAAGNGYPPATFTQIRRIPCESDSATATAYRTGRLQVVPGRAQGPGAIAAPLITSSTLGGQCIGVLSAELLDGWETSEAVHATASILASQLAAVVAADSEEQSPTRAGGAHG